MSIVSYAQNLEDVVLWRVLGDVEHGRYVDVGAADPEEHSVTHAFYARGWTGINIEPVQEHFDRLVAARERDLNLKVACARESGLLTLHAIAGTGLSTIDQAIAERHQKAGWKSAPVVVPALPLSAIVRDYSRDTVHFLKIDVEGSEEAVIAGTDLTAFRPWIILVESTAPLSTLETSGAWEPMLLHNGYEFAYFDGLNRFYVAAEQSRLIDRLAIPPNVFDEYERVGDQRVRIALDFERGETRRLLSETERADAALAASSRDAEQFAARVALAEAQLAAVEEARLEDVARLAKAEAQLTAVEEARSAEVTEVRRELERLREDHAEVAKRARQFENELSVTRSEFERKLARAESSVALLQGALDAERVNVIAQLSEAAERADKEIRAASQRAASADRELALTLKSHSWRVTAPGRALGDFARDKILRRLRGRGRRILAALPFTGQAGAHEGDPTDHRLRPLEALTRRLRRTKSRVAARIQGPADP